MSVDDSNTQQQPTTSPAPISRRRSSFTTNRLSEMFSSARNPQSNSPPNSPPNANPPTFNQNVFGNNAQSNATATGRRMSISTLGLSGSNNGTGAPASAGANSASAPNNLWGFRRGSFSTGPPSNASSDESAIDDAADAVVNGNAVNASGPGVTGRRGSGNAGNVPPGSPFGRRMSFGARAMGQMRNDNQGFNWADNLRNRQSRSSSAAGAGLMSPTRGSMTDSMAQPPSQSPAPRDPAPLPKREGPMKKPDHFQERILKGDFYMD